jgi:hypothetical protein
MSLIRQIIMLAAITPFAMSCKENGNIHLKASPQNNSESHKRRSSMNHPAITSQYDNADIARIPTEVEMNREQIEYIEKILRSVRSVIDGSSTLEAEEKEILGEGEFFWPKDPKKPAMLSKSYISSNFRMQGIYLKFSRESAETPWSKAGISLTPRNYPMGVFIFSMPEGFFQEFKLTNVERQERLNERLVDITVFTFESKDNKNISMIFEARSDIVSITDKYPRNFHLLWVEQK